ncbi:MAG TPA: hypothetical protein VJJ82_02170 [Candidatus Nanoarchaeia archaeon]|nr:hypothetical protein [Candidatus Nanoarchaeia archaeon]
MPEIQIYVKRASDNGADSQIADVHHASFLSGARHAYLVANPELKELVRLNHVGEVMLAFIPDSSGRPRYYTTDSRCDFAMFVSPFVPKQHLDGLVKSFEASDYIVKVQELHTDALDVAHLK